MKNKNPISSTRVVPKGVWESKSGMKISREPSPGTANKNSENPAKKGYEIAAVIDKIQFRVYTSWT